ncbi:MAG: sigma-70 family RNA polymerase sigma factor [Pyrinomonadaceae bacterium]
MNNLSPASASISGEKDALSHLVPLVYEELHRLAQNYLRRERPDHTLQATALINEAYLRLNGNTRIEWQNRSHFVGVAAEIMRRILVDHARTRNAEKRGGDLQRVSISVAERSSEDGQWDLELLDDALSRLTKMDERKGRLVELRFFGGLSNPEIAEIIGVSVKTVERDWMMARAWLKSELSNNISDA